MVFCIVCIPVVRVVIDCIDSTENISQILEEESSEQEAEDQKEFYSKQGVVLCTSIGYYFQTSLDAFFFVLLKKENPYIKVPLLPPDSFHL